MGYDYAGLLASAWTNPVFRVGVYTALAVFMVGHTVARVINHETGLECPRHFSNSEDAIIVLLATAAFGQNIGAWFNTLGGRITTTGTR